MDVNCYYFTVLYLSRFPPKKSVDGYMVTHNKAIEVYKMLQETYGCVDYLQAYRKLEELCPQKKINFKLISLSL